MDPATDIYLALCCLGVLATDASRGFPLGDDDAALALGLAHVHAPALGPQAAIALRLYTLSRQTRRSFVSRCLTPQLPLPSASVSVPNYN